MARAGRFRFRILLLSATSAFAAFTAFTHKIIVI